MKTRWIRLREATRGRLAAGAPGWETGRAAAPAATGLWLLLVLAAAAVTHARVLSYDFVWDDLVFIVWNEALRDASNVARIFVSGETMGIGTVNPYYRPVTTLSFALNALFFDQTPVGYHATNLVLHLGVCVLVFLAARALTGRRLPAGAAALFFAVHPAVAEPVAYVSARADLLCGGFSLLAFLLHRRGRETGAAADRVLSYLAFALAALAKIVALTVLPLLILHEAVVVPRGRRRFRALVPFAALGALYLVVRSAVLELETWGDPAPFSRRVAAAGALLVDYVRNTVLPFDLKVFYDLPARGSWGDPGVLGAWALLAGAASLWLVFFRKWPVVGFGAAWFFAALAPVSGIPGFILPAPMADRYLYVPLVGAALALAGVVAAAQDARVPSTRGGRAGRALGVGAASVYLVALAVSTASRLPDWRDSVALWEEAFRGAPSSAYVVNNLGWTYKRYGRLEEAERLIAKAVALDPNHVAARVNLASLALMKEDFPAAARHANEALTLDPGNPVALRFLGVVLAAGGHLDPAIEMVRQSVASDPADRFSRDYLAELLAVRSAGP